MAPPKRDAPDQSTPTGQPSKKHRPAPEAAAPVTPHGPLRNRHLQAVINDNGAEHSPITNGHHRPITTTIEQAFGTATPSQNSSPSLGSGSTPNSGGLNISKHRRSIVLNRSIRATDLTAYAAKENLDSTLGTLDHLQNHRENDDGEPPTPTLSRVEYKNNLKSLHEIMSKSFDPKRAFNYNFINIMNTFINNDKGNIDFKLIALSLDAGTRVWTSKVDVVFRNTQKVSNSLSMATDEKGGSMEDFDEDGLMFESTFVKEKKKAAAKKKKKVAPTIVVNPETTINGKLELNIAVDPLFHHFSAAFDVGNVNSLLMANLACDPVGTLLLDSGEKLDFSGYTVPPSSTLELFDFPELDVDSGALTVCPAMGGFDITDFSFNDREASIDHLAEVVGGSSQSPQDTSAEEPNFLFDLDAPVDDIYLGDDLDDNNNFDGQDYHGDDGIGGGGGSGGGVGIGEGDDPLHQHHLLNNQLDFSMLESHLLDILPANKNEFFNKNFLRKVFRKVAFFKNAGRSLLGGPNQEDSAAAAAAKPKRNRPTYVENTYNASDIILGELFEEPSNEVIESLCYSVTTLNRWSATSERLRLKDDYGFDTHLLKKPFSKPDSYFYDFQRQRVAAVAAGQHHHHQNNAAAGGFGDDDDDIGSGGGPDYEDDGVGGGGHDDEYNYEPQPIQTDFNLNDDDDRRARALGGEELPGHVDPLDIDYCRVAKKVDIKRVKKGMWDIINEATTEQFPTDPSQPASEATTDISGGLTFSSLRQTLPNHLKANLNENLSLPTSFVALLHLCNDKDLVLTPMEQANDHSDFVIMKTTTTVCVE